MFKGKNKKNSVAKFILVFCLFFVLFFSPVFAPKANADMWAGFIAETFQETLAKMYRDIDGAIRGALKQVSVKTLMKQVTSMVTKKSGGGPMFITDWKDFLRMKPQMNANKFINDYITQTLRGRNSSSQYIPANSEGFGGGGGSYLQSLGEMAKKSTSEMKNPSVTYTGDPSQMFADGNFKNMSLYLSGINNPWAYNLDVQAKYAEEKRQEELKAMTQAIAGQGFIGKTNKKGQTLTPGSTVKDMLSAAQDAGNKIIGGATSVPEVITSMVTSIITQALGQGIGDIGSQLDKHNSSSKDTGAGSWSKTMW